MDPKPLPGLEFELTYRVRTVNPLEPTAGSPYGAKQYWQVSEATLRVLGSARSWHRPVWTGCWLVLTGFGGLTFMLSS